MPRSSVSAKLYLAFLILAGLVTLGSLLAIGKTCQFASLSAEFEAASEVSRYVEQVNGLIYGVVMESRGIYMSPDIAAAKRYAEGLSKLNDRISAVVRSWGAAVGADDAGQFAAFRNRIDQFQEFRNEVARRGVEIGPAAAREWGDNDANRSVTIALIEDI